MDKRKIIRQCRYYKGEDKCPYSDGSMSWFWDMERVYVAHNGKFVGEAATYKAIGGKEYPGIPFDLLMVMFTSWGKFTTNLRTSLSEFYRLIDEYLFIPNDHIPENVIPC